MSSELAHRQRWGCLWASGVAVAVVCAAVAWLRFSSIPVVDLPTEINSPADPRQLVRSAPDRETSRLAFCARLDHLVNPLPEYRRNVAFGYVLTTPELPGERFLVFYVMSSADVALAYRCAPGGQLLSKGWLDVSP